MVKSKLADHRKDGSRPDSQLQQGCKHIHKSVKAKLEKRLKQTISSYSALNIEESDNHFEM